MDAEPRLRLLVTQLALVPPVLVAIAVPKCPACLAAHLAFLGVGVGAAGAILPLLLPSSIALALALWWRARKRGSVSSLMSPRPRGHSRLSL